MIARRRSAMSSHCFPTRLLHEQSRRQESSSSQRFLLRQKQESGSPIAACAQLPHHAASAGLFTIRSECVSPNATIPLWSGRRTLVTVASRGILTCSASAPLIRLQPNEKQYRRYFQSEGEYHMYADDALNNMQDTLDEVLEQAVNENGNLIEYELSLASGVLTLQLPPHGTWVINKQTPNQQLWWSSPLSGPKRFEYFNDDDDKSCPWISTKDGLALGPLLVQELRHVHPHIPEFEFDF